MTASPGENSSNCGGCRECPIGATLPEGLSGWRLIATAFGVFLWPLLTAVAGAMAGGSSQTGQLAGGIIGFSFGVIIAAICCRVISRSKRRGNRGK